MVKARKPPYQTPIVTRTLGHRRHGYPDTMTPGTEAQYEFALPRTVDVTGSFAAAVARARVLAIQNNLTEIGLPPVGHPFPGTWAPWVISDHECRPIGPTLYFQAIYNHPTHQLLAEQVQWTVDRPPQAFRITPGLENLMNPRDPYAFSVAIACRPADTPITLVFWGVRLTVTDRPPGITIGLSSLLNYTFAEKLSSRGFRLS